MNSVSKYIKKLLTVIVLLFILVRPGISQSILFGICADVHKDVIPDANTRLQKFIDKMNDQKVDFIIQLGDFCQPLECNKDILETWNSFKGQKFHVLGNHDMDGGFSREETVKFMGMKNRYYSYDQGGFHFIVLDGNDISDPLVSGYPHDIGKKQEEWLRKDLEKTDLKVIVFSHQSLEDEVDGIVRKAVIRKVLEDSKTSRGIQKVIACFSGHHHFNYYRRINGIYYIQINSMAYQWVGSDYAYNRYDEKTEEHYPHVSSIAPYEDALYASVIIDDEAIKIQGIESEWIKPSPWELGYHRLEEYHKIVPEIFIQTLYFSKEKINQTPGESPKDFFAWVTINPKSIVFENQQEIVLTASEPNVEIRYNLNNQKPDAISSKYSDPLTIHKSTKLTAAAFRNGKVAGIISRGNYTKARKIKSIKLNNDYNPKYSGGGNEAIIDFKRGSADFLDGHWQGYEGDDLDVVLDLGKSDNINIIKIGFLRIPSTWIFLPRWIEISVSENGHDFQVIEYIENIASTSKIKDVTTELKNIKTRFIWIKAKNIEKCPEGHPGAGGKAWLFVDEIIVE